MHCGYLPRSRWVGEQPDVRVECIPPYDGDICPGWLTQQLAVIEGAQAYAARRDGVLSLFDPLGSNTIWEAADVATQAFGRKQMQDAARTTKKS